jgi:diguanylate cyclase (GGDEF)-like protein
MVGHVVVGHVVVGHVMVHGVVGVGVMELTARPPRAGAHEAGQQAVAGWWPRWPALLARMVATSESPRLLLMITALGGAAALALWWVAPLPARHAPYAVPWWLLAGLFCAAEICVVHLQFRREAQSFSLSEVPLTIGLFFDRPLAVVLACLLGVAVALTLHRRQSWSKLAFNLANFTIGAAVAVALFSALAPAGDPIGIGACLAAVGAVTAAGSLQTATFMVAMFLVSGRVELRGQAGTYGLAVFGTVINACLALVLVNLMWFHLEASWLLVVPVAGVTLAYRSYVGERENREQLAFLYESSRRLQQAGDLDQALLGVLRGAADTFRADTAELLILPAHPGDAVLRARVAPGRMEPMRPLELTDPEHALLVRTVAAAPAILEPRPGDDDGPCFLALEGLRDGMVALLQGETRPFGLLMVGNRVGSVGSFNGEDLRLFEMLAAHTGSILRNGRLEHSLRQLTDLQHKLRHQALHDPLTGMANRSLFQSSVRGALAEGAERVGVLFIDLDDFKTVNDSLGHVVGDELLKAVAGRVAECLRPGDVAARLGGDEFAVLLPGLADSRAATGVAGRIVERLHQPFEVMGAEVVVAASIGVATGASGELGGDDLLRNADEAMYTAKGLGKGRWEVFAPSMHAAVLSRHQFKADLHRALERDELTLDYQPMFEVGSGAVVAAEALLRWRHPGRGPVAPTEFIPLAEETGLIGPIGTWVLERACAEARRWPDHGARPDIAVAVNVSARQFRRGRFPDEVEGIVSRTGLDPRRLIVEVTESQAIDESSGATAALERLREMGIRIALDDFGTGFSSLSRLRELPIDIIKIDRGFTITLTGGDEAIGLSRAVFAFTNMLGVTVVAEGVEAPAHLRALAAFPDQWAQGFHLCGPLGAVAFRRFLARRAAPRAEPRVLQLPVQTRAS